MNSDYVVVFRMEDNVDLIGVIVSEKDLVVKIERPHFVSYNTKEGAIQLMPYCSLTDQTLFEFPRDKMKFLAPATDQIAESFVVSMCRTIIKQQLLNEGFDGSPNASFTTLSGNDTRH